MHSAEQLEAARKTLRGLEKKRDAITGRKTELDAERERIAFAAHAGGDKKAAERLTAIESEEGELDRRAKGITAALRTAQSEVEAALAAVEAQARATRARESLALADELDAAAGAAGEALTSFVAAMGRIKRAMTSLRQNDALMSPASLVDINIQRAIKSELIDAGLAEATVAKGQRSTIAEIVGSYAETARLTARGQLPAVDMQEKAA